MTAGAQFIYGVTARRTKFSVYFTHELIFRRITAMNIQTSYFYK